MRHRYPVEDSPALARWEFWTAIAMFTAPLLATWAAALIGG